MVQNSPLSLQEIKDAYLYDTYSNENAAKLFPIETNIQGESGTPGFRYLIFPCLNERLYKHKEILGQYLA